MVISCQREGWVWQPHNNISSIHTQCIKYKYLAVFTIYQTVHHSTWQQSEIIHRNISGPFMPSIPEYQFNIVEGRGYFYLCNFMSLREELRKNGGKYRKIWIRPQRPLTLSAPGFWILVSTRILFCLFYTPSINVEPHIE